MLVGRLVKKFSLPFFGIKPRNRNLSVGRPLIDRAAIEADGPGMEWIEISCLIASLTR